MLWLATHVAFYWRRDGLYLIGPDVQAGTFRVELHDLLEHLLHQTNSCITVWVQGAQTVVHLPQISKHLVLQDKLIENILK